MSQIHATLETEHTKTIRLLDAPSADQMQIGGRQMIVSRTGRAIVIFRVAEREFSSMDSICYHAGGALGKEGDIEDLGGQLHLACPEHKHRVNVRFIF